MNVLVIVNYDSDSEVTSLISKSEFYQLQITHVIVHCNGKEVSDSALHMWVDLAQKKGLTLERVHRKNLGYGVAINEWLESKIEFKYLFFSNADLWIESERSTALEFREDIIGFGLWQNSKLLLTKVSVYTPLFPVRILKNLGFQNKFGSSSAVHGGFFGVRKDFIDQSGLRFNDDYFLYWDELWFCYEAKRKYNASIAVSDGVIVNHDGDKAGKGDDTRYYMIRNGLDFYFRCSRLYIAGVLYLALNMLYALTCLVRGRPSSWFFDGVRDFYAGKLGARWL